MPTLLKIVKILFLMLILLYICQTKEAVTYLIHHLPNQTTLEHKKKEAIDF